MGTSSNITGILNSFVFGISEGFAPLYGYAESLFGKLLVIEIIIFGIGIALNRADIKTEIVFKILAVCFVQYLIYRYVWLTHSMVNGFVKIGLIAGGSNLDVSGFMDPSAYISQGMDQTYAAIKVRFDHGWTTYLTSPAGTWIFYGLVLVLMLAAYVAMAFNIFFAVIEFYLISSISIIFLPFLVLQKTSFLGFKAINLLLSACIKLMVLAFVASLSKPILENLVFVSENPTLKESFSLALGVLLIAILMWKAPRIAASFISGSPGLDVNSSFTQPVSSAAYTTLSFMNIAKKSAGSGVGAVTKAAGAAFSGANVAKKYFSK